MSKIVNKKPVNDMTLGEIMGTLAAIGEKANDLAKQYCKTENLDEICRLRTVSNRAGKELDRLYMLEQLIEHMRIQLEKTETRESAY